MQKGYLKLLLRVGETVDVEWDIFFQIYIQPQSRVELQSQSTLTSKDFFPWLIDVHFNRFVEWMILRVSY